MFSFLRSGNQDAPKVEPGEPVIAFLLLAQREFPVAEAVERLRALPFAADMSATSTGEDGIVAFYIGDEVVGVGNMGAPFPENLDSVYASSWMFPEAAGALGQHASHVIISLTGGSAEPAQRMALLTRVAAALTREPGVMGIYMPDAGVVHRPDIFAQMAEKMGNTFPIYLWVNMACWKNPDGTNSLATTGLAKLGRREIEVLNVMVQPSGMREFVYGTAHTVITHNPPVKDGMEMARFGTSVLRGYLKRSVLPREGTVLRMTT